MQYVCNMVSCYGIYFRIQKFLSSQTMDKVEQIVDKFLVSLILEKREQ